MGFPGHFSGYWSGIKEPCFPSGEEIISVRSMSSEKWQEKSLTPDKALTIFAVTNNI